MPTYRDPVHGISLSEQVAEAAAVATLTPMLHTFEIFHPVGTVDPIYLVADQQNLLATKEATAERDAGLEVEWLAISIKQDKPEESDQAASPEITLTVSNVSGLIAQALRVVRQAGSLDPWIIIERLYIPGDTGGPAILPPRQMYITDFDIDQELVTLHCSYGDSVNVAVPSTTFSRSQYPTLVI